tara:strand:- start:91 stop:294 length:204 start_codon:yes stop_codon:yes gene_type:complete
MKLINNELVEETAEDIAQAEKDITTFTANEEAKAEARANQDALKASAKAKLIAGEALTEAEADTIVL